MTTIVMIIHIVVCVSLILIVLLQTGKGADMGAAFGGGSSQTLFGSTGASTFLGKATTAVAIIFMITSLILAVISTRETIGSSILKGAESVQQPAVPAPDETDGTLETSAPAAADSEAQPAPSDSTEYTDEPGQSAVPVDSGFTQEENN